MTLTRRQTLALAGGAAIASNLPAFAHISDNGMEEAITAFTGGITPNEGGVEIEAPEIAENGSSVPVRVAAEGASAILLVSSHNPNPGVATFTFGALSATPSAKTRIRLSQTQDLVAVAKMADGSFARASRTVEVIVGGCSG